MSLSPISESAGANLRFTSRWEVLKDPRSSLPGDSAENVEQSDQKTMAVAG